MQQQQQVLEQQPVSVPCTLTCCCCRCCCCRQVVRELSRDSSLRTAVLVGGDAMEAQFAELAANPDIIVATPGARTF